MKSCCSWILIVLCSTILPCISGKITIPLRAVAASEDGLMLFEGAKLSNLPVNLSNHYNLQYTGNLYAGSNQQAFRVMFDTGSDPFWLQSPNCSTCFRPHGFNCSASTTCKMTDEKDSITYEKGEVHGTKFMDQIGFWLNGTRFSHDGLLVTKSLNSPGALYDGIFGLSSDFEGKNVLTSMKNTGMIKNRIFAVHLTQDPLSDGYPDSLIVFDGYEESYIQTNYTYIPLANISYKWSVWVTSLKVEGEIKRKARTIALIDTGTSFLFMPSEEWSSFTAKLNASSNNSCSYLSGKLYCDCKHQSRMPEMVFVFEGSDKEFIMNASDYTTRVSNSCRIDISNQTETYGGFIFGMTFIRRFSILFDLDQDRIGIARSTLAMRKWESNYSKWQSVDYEAFKDEGLNWWRVYLIVFLCVWVLFCCWKIFGWCKKLWTKDVIPNPPSSSNNLGTPLTAVQMT